MVRLPSNINIGPFCYEIVAHEEDIIQGDGPECLGITDHDNQKILINASLAHEMLVETLFHEILHAVCSATGLDYEWGERKEERYVRMISPMMIDTLRRNPEVTAFLLSLRDTTVGIDLINSKGV